MNQTLLQYVAKKFEKTVPRIEAGYTVRVHQKIKEGGKERIQIFEGLVIKTNGKKGVNQTITVRKVVSGVGVEKVFPLHCGNIVKIEVKKMGKVRRAKLYYMRERSGKSARLKEQHVDIAMDITPIEPEVSEVKEEQTEQTEAPAEQTDVEDGNPKAEEAPADEDAAPEKEE